ncbi:transposase [Yinghuangia seranimata]|uniref:transposase n=1 Tax=Yinghuangia seranimata TaxID=408067 RepID=UPI003CCF8415
MLLAGRSRARMLRIVHAGLSRTSVLFHLMRVPFPPVTARRVLGVDDFALYGDVYGTLLVDAENRLPVTLWEGRDAATLAAWLREHPGLEVVCRDGSPTYRLGVTVGAPDVVQVSDRFHLWQGLSKRVQQIAAAHRGCRDEAVVDTEPAALPSAVCDALESADTPARRHAKRLFDAVHALTDTGRSYNSAARELGLNWRTVRKYAAAATWQDVVRRRRPRSPTALYPYLGYLRQRWNEGEHSAKLLHEELTAKDYTGHYQHVKMAVAPMREGLFLAEPHELPPSPRSLVGSPPARTDAAWRPMSGCTACSPTAPNSTERTRWSASSRPCSRPATRPHCRAGSANSLPASFRPSPAWRRRSAKTRTRSSRGSLAPTAPGSTRDASPTSNSNSASWQDVLESPSYGTGSSSSPTYDAAARAKAVRLARL